MEFILNDKAIRTDKPGGMTLLDFIRYDNHLTGTKIGCREGDCGACTVLVGELLEGRINYKSMTSCITPLANVRGKHVVTIEGLNMEALSPVQQAFVETGGTQCGFCTAGFIVSLSGYCMSGKEPEYNDGISAIDGNICRCTGYKSIERATALVIEKLAEKDVNDPVSWLVNEKFIPKYFLEIPKKLMVLKLANQSPNGHEEGLPKVGGGTDLYVQRPDDMVTGNVHAFYDVPALNNITLKDGQCRLGGEVTVSDLMDSKAFNHLFPNLKKHLKLVSSTQIRNMGTIAGNFVNASPIGDLTIFFLALDSVLTLSKTGGASRKVRLQEFYLGYKKLDLGHDEIVEFIEFSLLDDTTYFNFEKVSKRKYLDIASVNTAIRIKENNGNIEAIHASAGGVGPTPLYLTKTCAYLQGKALTPENIRSAVECLNEDISPISDVRGSKDYKALLLRQLFFAHFIELFPEKFEMEVLV
ncbi:xanthine dehydrogenase small subunit [Fulvivirga kasyanovii]|uniref:2Fe-2S iron-sulfur cluster binding domain-containing protein n=1 Tax=Fulvivirga kasyanovii TaxID=396812 RepID=A0ABW9RQL2_9BACT|nr:FAD binding domain-containing protein [Fulvivirga kasyanovii]MTI26469.1 2Fe-2S iron-sulfur cluster binding domain-containing protein [Fulvivirga kasyanovii]